MLKIGQVIRKQRLSLGMTQEGQSYPDIELLPQLARVLQLDLNALLDFHPTITPEATREFSATLAQKSGFEAYEFAKAKLHEYPQADDLRLMINSLLQVQKPAMSTSQWATTATFIEGNYLRVSRGSNLHLAQQAAQMLFYFYLNEESFADAQGQLSELSDAVIAYNAMKPELYLRQGDISHAYQAGEELLLQNVAGVTRVLSILIKNALNDHNPDYAKACLEVGNALTNALQTKDAFLSDAALLIAKSNHSSKQVLNVLTALINQFDQTDTSPVFAHHQPPTIPQTMSKKQTIQMALMQFKADPDLSFAMNDPQLDALFKKYEVD